MNVCDTRKCSPLSEPVVLDICICIYIYIVYAHFHIIHLRWCAFAQPSRPICSKLTNQCRCITICQPYNIYKCACWHLEMIIDGCTNDAVCRATARARYFSRVSLQTTIKTISTYSVFMSLLEMHDAHLYPFSISEMLNASMECCAPLARSFTSRWNDDVLLVTHFCRISAD